MEFMTAYKMMTQPLLPNKILHTFTTLEQVLLYMEEPLMSSQGAGSLNIFTAHIAGKRSFPRMSSFMVNFLLFRCKIFITPSTFERFLFMMRPLMNSQVRMLFKRHITLSALKRSLSCMNSLMFMQVVLRSKPLATCIAF